MKRDINTLTDHECNNLLRKIRHKAERDGETIKTIRDPYGAPCYMVVDSYTNCVVTGEHGIDLGALAEMYNVAI